MIPTSIQADEKYKLKIKTSDHMNYYWLLTAINSVGKDSLFLLVTFQVARCEDMTVGE